MKKHKGEGTALYTENETAETKPYYAGIDMIKILAAFFVVCIHFFLRSGFYDAPMSDTRLVPFLLMRFLVYNCVPLFMISTGYLMKNKRFSPACYKGLIKVVVIYVFISLLCVKFNIIHLGMVYTKWDILRGMLMYTNDSYAWYVNYYLSLLLIIPFLNSAFSGLETQKERLALYLISFIFDCKNYYGLAPEYRTIHQRLFFFIYDGAFIGFNEKYTDIYTRCTHCYEIILKNFFSSLFWALIITNAYKLCEYGVRKWIDAVRGRADAAEKTKLKTDCSDSALNGSGRKE